MAEIDLITWQLELYLPESLSDPIRFAFIAHFLALSAAHPHLDWQQDPELEPNNFVALCLVDTLSEAQLLEQTECLLFLAGIHTFLELPAHTLALAVLIDSIHIRALYFAPFPADLFTDEEQFAALN